MRGSHDLLRQETFSLFFLSGWSSLHVFSLHYAFPTSAFLGQDADVMELGAVPKFILCSATAVFFA